MLTKKYADNNKEIIYAAWIRANEIVLYMCIFCSDVDTDCSGYLISGPNRINDSELTASSILLYSATGFSRLNTQGDYTVDPALGGGWVSNVQDIYQYIQVT